MRLSRTDLVPVLTIVAGGILGASLSPGFFGSRSADPAPDSALGMVTGQVTDAQTGLPVVAAQLYITNLDRRGLDQGSLSQQNGRYLLQNVRVGTYTVTVARNGYQTTDVQITVGRGQTMEQNFSLAEQASPLNAVTIEKREGWFLEAMEARRRAAEPHQPVEVRAIRQR